MKPSFKDLITPSEEVIDKYIDKFNNDERYYLADNSISRLFDKFPENKELEDILLKISVINDLYSTNIFATFLMAKHIQLLQIDEDLRLADSTLVNRIATGHGIKKSKNTGDRNFYSFATKYCSWHNRDNYPIFDDFVERVLKAYRDRDKFSKFKNEDLRSFEKLKVIISDFKIFYQLNRHGLKQIDKFLWVYGKEKFPKNYSTKQVDILF